MEPGQAAGIPGEEEIQDSINRTCEKYKSIYVNEYYMGMKQEQGGNSELVRRLEKEIIQIIETDSDFVIGPFPLDVDIRNYKRFLNSYSMEKHRRNDRCLCEWSNRLS